MDKNRKLYLVDKTAEDIWWTINSKDIWYTKKARTFGRKRHFVNKIAEAFGRQNSRDIGGPNSKRHLVDKTAETFGGQNSKRHLMDQKYHWTSGGQNSRDN